MRISNRCYAVTGLGYSTPWCVNAGFIAGDRVTLIVDTGANTLAAETLFGYATAVAPENQIRVINTEKHFDHIGGNSFFEARGIEIFGHHAIARTPAEFEEEIEEFNAAISDPARRATGEARAFFHRTSLANPNRPIRQETKLDLGGSVAEIIFTPGHTPTNISIWLAEERVLFTGDCLIHEYMPNLAAAGGRAGWQIWLESLRRIEALNPAIVVAGHGSVARGTEIPSMIAAVRDALLNSMGHLDAGS